MKARTAGLTTLALAAGFLTTGTMRGSEGIDGAMAARGTTAVTATGTATAAAEGDPLAGYSTHIVATHYLRGEAYETHHYFKPLRDGVLQGLVFRETSAGTPLIEVEWAIGEAVYQALPDWQKDHWHPLAPAVDAGRVRVPGLSPAEERDALAGVRGLYAQTLNLAGIRGELPVGVEGVSSVTHLTRAEMRGAGH